MKEFKGTKGEWSEMTKNDHNEIYIHVNGIEICKTECRYGKSIDYLEEVEANAELIADAGTTANKCGLLPSELLARNEELLEALEELNTSIDQYWNTKHKPDSLIKAINEAQQLAHKAITKAQGE